MNLETVSFPGEYLLHREELEGRGSCVQCLRQGSLLNFFVIFQPLRYACRRKPSCLEATAGPTTRLCQSPPGRPGPAKTPWTLVLS